MTTVMQRPRSTQPGSEMNSSAQRSHDDAFNRSVPRMSSSSSTITPGGNAFNLNDNLANNNDTSNENGGRALSPPPSLPGTFLGGQSGEFSGGYQHHHHHHHGQDFFLEPSGSVGNPSSSLHAALTPGGAPQDDVANVSDNAFSTLNFARGIFEDPAILALATQHLGPRIDFSLDLAGEQDESELMPEDVGGGIFDPSSLSIPTSSSSSSSTSAAKQLASIQDNLNASLSTSSSESARASSTSYPHSPSSTFLASNLLTSNPSITPKPSSLQHLDPFSSSSSANIAGSTAISDIDFTSMGLLQFPELPASLLDQAPEYEYSIHTQANVFDAVQDYSGAGDEEAARIFGLDNYEGGMQTSAATSENMAAAAAVAAANNMGADDLWRYQDANAALPDPHSSSSFGAQNLSSAEGFASFQDAQSMLSSSEYPFEPSTAPTSRGSDWKIDPSVMNMAQLATAGTMGKAGQMQPNAKRRRGSFDGRMASSFVQQSLDPNGHKIEGTIDGRSAPREPVVPSQNAGNQRARMASWAGDSGRTDSSWTSNNGQDLSGAYGNLMTFGQGQRLSLGSNDSVTSNASANASANAAARNEMINAIGNVMDAKMDTDGVAKCPYPNCTKTFAKNRSYNLKAHLRSHSQLKPFSCTHCPRAFSRKHDLERHSRVHSGDKPYLCEACGKGFPRSDALRRHWRVEKECGDKAVEIEAKQPLPSLPPGVNTPAAQAKGPIPGMMQFNAPTTTAMAGMSMQIPASGMMANQTFIPFHAPYPAQAMMPQMGWDPTMQQVPQPMPPYGAYPGIQRKRQREE